MTKSLLKAAALAIVATSAILSCNKEPQERYDADIIISFSVKNANGDIIEGEIGKDTVFLKVNPYVDAKEYLKGCTPTFFISNGATVEPAADLKQDFGVDGGFVYTVTSKDGKVVHKYVVTYKNSEHLPYGSGFSYCEITDGVNADYGIDADGNTSGGFTSFTDLGWPGTRMLYYKEDGSEYPSELYGDLDCYIGYCGKYIVAQSRIYCEMNDAQNATKVIDKVKLTPEGKLNLGGIGVTDLMMVSNDWYGRLVAVVDNGATSDLYYWKDPFQAPVKLGTAPVDLAPSKVASEDASNNFQVVGDITKDACITAQAGHNDDGDHYLLTIAGGALQPGYDIISTGYASNDNAQYQTISLITDTVPIDKPNYLVGDTEGEYSMSPQNHMVKIWLSTWEGDYFGEPATPFYQGLLQGWWVGNGCSLARMGNRRPYLASMLINGKNYILFAGGTAWWGGSAVFENDPEINTLAHENTNIACYTGTINWSYGQTGAWYWDKEECAGYYAVWFGRAGLITRKLTCFE